MYRPSAYAVKIAGILLCHVTVVRYLGLYIDQHLTWQQHIDHMVSKARAQLYCIRHLHTFVCLFMWFNASSFYHSLISLL